VSGQNNTLHLKWVLSSKDKCVMQQKKRLFIFILFYFNYINFNWEWMCRQSKRFFIWNGCRI